MQLTGTHNRRSTAARQEISGIQLIRLGGALRRTAEACSAIWRTESQMRTSFLPKSRASTDQVPGPIIARLPPRIAVKDKSRDRRDLRAGWPVQKLPLSFPRMGSTIRSATGLQR